MKTIFKLFLTGLFTTLPVLATIYLIVWMFTGAEQLVGSQLKWMITADQYRSGMCIAAAFIAIVLIGLLMRAWLFREVFGHAERVLLGVPLVRSIYTALRDLIGLFAHGGGDEISMQVVSVELPGTGMRLLGFVTRANLDGLPTELGREGDVAVYLPMSYMVGGFTVFLPRAAITPVDMTREVAMKFIITAGIRSTPNHRKTAP